MKKKITALAFAVLAMAGVGSASAYSVDYGYDGNGSRTRILSTDLQLMNSLAAKADFLSKFSAGIARVEDFELQPVGPGPLALEFGTGSRAVSATLGGGGGAVVESTESVEGRFSVQGGKKFWSATARPTATDAFKVDFDFDVEGFGFFGIDIGDFGGNLLIDLLDSSGAVKRTIAQAIPDSGRGGSVAYYGIKAADSSEWFRSVQFRMSSAATADDGFAFDSFTVVGAERTIDPGVPEPGSLALASLALFGLAWARRRS